STGPPRGRSWRDSPRRRPYRPRQGAERDRPSTPDSDDDSAWRGLLGSSLGVDRSGRELGAGPPSDDRTVTSRWDLHGTWLRWQSHFCGGGRRVDAYFTRGPH